MVESDSCGTGDTSAPRTTHVLAPATPNGDGGWYDSDVKVTLSATDNDGGSGVDKTEYREQGAANWTAYSAPFDGHRGRLAHDRVPLDRQEGQRRVDAVGHVQARQDRPGHQRQAQRRGAEGRLHGDVAVDLDATDATSGVKATEIRVDGGEWKPYVEEETILNSAADLAKWAQAGPGGLTWNTADGGFVRPHGGLGMPWYPVKDYGDFSLKFQWRDSGTGSTGNGGAFVRFPNPAEAVTRTAANRYPCQVGSGQTDPAWVAIYCGHEIQVNDNQASETQKTGSVYNFSPLNATQAKVQPRGTWVDYEIKVVGQTYTISRNGEVLQTFENTPGKTSSRSGDPSTTDRQFTRGYIGLQNHSNGDVIDYRNVRVLSLDAGSARGPVTVVGQRRAHGRVPLDRRGGQRGGDQEGRVHDRRRRWRHHRAGDHQLAHPGLAGRGRDLQRPGQRAAVGHRPGAGRRWRRRAEDGRHNAAPDHWEPNALTATVGDTVRWNFPAATAGTVHDVWIIKPGESPTSDGTKLSPRRDRPSGRPAGHERGQRCRRVHVPVQDPRAQGRGRLAGHGRDRHRRPGRRLRPRAPAWTTPSTASTPAARRASGSARTTPAREPVRDDAQRVHRRLARRRVPLQGQGRQHRGHQVRGVLDPGGVGV